MNFAKKALVDELIIMASRGGHWTPSDSDTDRLRAIILLSTSHSPDACRDVEALSYGLYSGVHDEAVRYRGLTAGSDRVPLTDITARLSALTEPPPSLAADFGSASSLECFRAAMLILHAIAESLEWSEYDERFDRLSTAEVENEISASLRSLESFRRNGDP